MSESVSGLIALGEPVLLRGVNRRLKNEFASAISLVSVAAVRANNSEVKAALSEVVELLHEHADVQCVLNVPKRDALVDAADYLARLCSAMGRSRMERMNIQLIFEAGVLRLQSERCWRLGLAIYELATNSVRHAYFDGREGLIKVTLRIAGHSVSCSVSDTGSGSAALRRGEGLSIVSDLAKTLGGDLDHEVSVEGVAFTLIFPLTQREQSVNRSRARVSRRRRPTHAANSVSPSTVIAAERTSCARQRRRLTAAAVALTQRSIADAKGEALHSSLSALNPCLIGSGQNSSE